MVRFGVSVLVVTSLVIFTETIMHLVESPPPPLQNKMHTLCFRFLLGITNLPREIEGNALICKLLGVNKVHYGIVQNGQFVCLRSVFPQFHTLSHSFLQDSKTIF